MEKPTSSQNPLFSLIATARLRVMSSEMEVVRLAMSSATGILIRVQPAVVEGSQNLCSTCGACCELVKLNWMSLWEPTSHLLNAPGPTVLVHEENVPGSRVPELCHR